MDIVQIISIFKVLAIITALIIFFFKLMATRRYKSKQHRDPGARWLLWYDTIQILGTSSPSYRDFMQKHNKQSTIMWVAVLLLILLYIVPF